MYLRKGPFFTEEYGALSCSGSQVYVINFKLARNFLKFSKPKIYGGHI